MITKIETRIRSYEIGGQEVTGLHNDADDVIIEAHRCRNEFVIIDFHGRSVTVCARDLERAIRNAQNHD